MNNKKKEANKKIYKGKVTTKEKNIAKRELFFEVLLPLLEAQGFTRNLQVPFIWESDWGWSSGASGYCYELVRIQCNYFEFLDVYIPSSNISRQFQIHLQILEIKFDTNCIKSVHLTREMTLNILNSKKNLLLNPSFCIYGMRWPRFAKPSYMLKRFFTRNGFKKRINQLKCDLIKDFSNLQPIINKWLEIQNPNIIDLNQMDIKKTTFLINGIPIPNVQHKKSDDD